MLKTGVCSVTFRQHGLQEVIDWVKRAELDAIEWGGDIHVPHGDTEVAQDARRLTLNAGLEVSSYGSYYSVLDAEGHPQEFESVLDSALALETETIRIWPGVLSSETTSATYRKKFIEKLRADLASAAKQGVRLAFEFHVNSLCDSNFAAQSLLDEVGHPNLYTYWQPMYWVADPAYRFQGLEKLAGRVLNLHVFNCLFHPLRGRWEENIERRPLGENPDEWSRFLSVPLPEGEHFALLEFIRNDDPEQFFADAVTLKKILSLGQRMGQPELKY